MVKSKKSEQKTETETKDRYCLKVRDRVFLMVAIIVVLGVLIIFSQKSETSMEAVQPTSESEYEDGPELESDLDQEPEISITVLTDKEVYHSNEEMEIKVLIETTEELPDSEIYLYGIDTGGVRGPRLEIEEDAEIKVGSTALSFEYTTPKCYGCAGISEGLYNINVELTDENGTIANATTEVEILK